MARSASVLRRSDDVTLPPQAVPLHVLHEALRRDVPDRDYQREMWALKNLTPDSSTLSVLRPGPSYYDIPSRKENDNVSIQPPALLSPLSCEGPRSSPVQVSPTRPMHMYGQQALSNTTEYRRPPTCGNTPRSAYSNNVNFSHQTANDTSPYPGNELQDEPKDLYPAYKTTHQRHADPGNSELPPNTYSDYASAKQNSFTQFSHTRPPSYPQNRRRPSHDHSYPPWYNGTWPRPPNQCLHNHTMDRVHTPRSHDDPVHSYSPYQNEGHEQQKLYDERRDKQDAGTKEQQYFVTAQSSQRVSPSRSAHEQDICPSAYDPVANKHYMSSLPSNAEGYPDNHTLPIHSKSRESSPVNYDAPHNYLQQEDTDPTETPQEVFWKYRSQHPRESRAATTHYRSGSHKRAPFYTNTFDSGLMKEPAIHHVINRCGVVASYVLVIANPLIDSAGLLHYVLGNFETKSRAERGPLAPVELIARENVIPVKEKRGLGPPHTIASPTLSIGRRRALLESAVRQTTSPVIVLEGFPSNAEESQLLQSLLGPPHLLMVLTMPAREVYRRLKVLEDDHSEDHILNASREVHTFDQTLPDVLTFFQSKTTIKILDFTREPIVPLALQIKNLLIKYLIPAGGCARKEPTHRSCTLPLR